MIFRLVSIVILKWVVNLFAVLALLRFVIPPAWHGNLKAAPIWLVSFILAFLFAEWAFARRLHGKRSTVECIVLWVVVSYTLNIFASVVTFATARVAIYGTDLHITTLSEIAAILLAAHATRRRKIEMSLGEGMAE
ncbi:MAG: hypothetical protein AAB879_00165 [Patescibacteria group bacterium]